MTTPPILFVFGPARGGTTFIGGILDKWFDVGTGPEGTFVQKAIRKGMSIGDLSKIDNRRRYAEYLSKVQMLEIIRLRYPEDARFSVTADDLLERMPGHEIGDAIYAVFKAVADYRNRSVVGNKNPEYWRYLDLLEHHFPRNSRYLFVLRDGRDVALSLRGVSWGGHSVYEAALEWRRMVREVENFRLRIEDNRFLTVRYEDVLSQPFSQLIAIGNLLEVDNVDGICQRYEIEGLRSVKSDNFDKWRTEMQPDDVRIFEALAGQELSRCGYTRMIPGAKITLGETLVFECRRLWRLARLNLYWMGSKLPQDKDKWRKTRLKKLLAPGSNKKI